MRVSLEARLRRRIFVALGTLGVGTLLLAAVLLTQTSLLQQSVEPGPGPVRPGAGNASAPLRLVHDSKVSFSPEDGVNGRSGDPPLRVVHLDLKGGPPRLSYLLHSFLPLAADAGANALLVEYEDMFPYQGKLTNLSATNAYSIKQVEHLVLAAEKMGFHVIPLIQTFGHLEALLKQQQWAHLREDHAYPDAICPSQPETLPLLREMMRQVLDLHPNSKYLHIGCDEVYHIGTCPLCSSKQMDDRQLFASHVVNVAHTARSLRAGLTPLIWDDMLRRWPPMELQSSKLSNLVEPVVWAYTEDIWRMVPYFAWHSYSQTFRAVWVAAAFKGASGETALAPNLWRTFSNHHAWLRLMKSRQMPGVASNTTPKIHFRAIVLTGWSRYDHFAVLCELLPVSLPSLLLNLHLVTRMTAASQEIGQKTEGDLITEALRKWQQQISCPRQAQPVTMASLESDPYQWRLLVSCGFPGNDLYSIVSSIASVVPRAEQFLVNVRDKRGWLTPYNIQHNFSSPHRVSEIASEAAEVSSELLSMWEKADRALRRYYDAETVSEWLEQRLASIQRRTANLEAAAKGLMVREHWPRRPLQGGVT